MAKKDELGDDGAWWPEYRRAPCNGMTGIFPHDVTELDVHGSEDLPDTRKTVKSATRADFIAVLGQDCVRVANNCLAPRRNDETDSVTQTAVRRNNSKPEQQRTK
jgi:hypothetical protein